MAVEVLKCVTTFDGVVDIDLGLVRLVLDEFNNPEYLITSIERIKNNLTTLRVLLADRELENPLSILFKPELEDQLDSLRNQFHEAYYERILSLSGETSISRLLTAASINKLFTDSTVICNSQIEVDFIKKIDLPVKCVLSNGTLLDSDRYNAFYLKRLSDLTLFEPLRDKNITTLEYRFNLESDLSAFKDHIPKKEYLSMVDPSNTIYTMQIYPGLDLPED